VGGNSDRAVVATCSYEARAFGVHSGMAVKIAKRLCPQILMIQGDMEMYSKYSRVVTEIVHAQVPLYEKSSIDEFYIDMSGMDKYFGCAQYVSQLKKTIVKESGFSFRCLLAGSGIDAKNQKLLNLIKSLNLNDNIELLGVISDVNQIFEKLDLHVLSSIDEAFPNVIAESMAIGVPIVSTNVGDAALIAGDLGWIVNPGDPYSIANGIIEAIIEMDKPEWKIRKEKSRERIIQYFSIEKMCKQYSNLWNYNIKLIN
jgi:hypothetical protein